MHSDKIINKLKGISWEDYELKDDVTIDKFNLDVDAEKQPMLYIKWSNALSFAQLERDKAKEAVKICKANLTLRGHDGECSGKKTDAGIKAWVEVHPEYIKALNLSLTTENNVSYLSSAKEALNHKKSMIEITAKLWLGGYFARPPVPKHAVQIAEQAQAAEALKSTDEALKRRKRRKIT